MQHLDEHTIAFYAMGAKFSAAERNAIEAHLEECHGCQGQVEELCSIDEHVAKVLDTEESSDDFHSEALTLSPRPIQKRVYPRPVRVQARSLTRAERFAGLIRRHPIRSGSVGIVFAFLLFFSFNKINNFAHKAEQPYFVKMNPLGTALEVFGKQTKIFEIPVDLPGATEDALQQQKTLETQITDLNGDGDLEVINGSPHLENGKSVGNVVRIFSSNGDLISEWPMRAQVSYNGAKYSGSYGISALAVVSGQTSSAKEILVGINNDRSPCCLRRLNAKGEMLGEYWHFGWLLGILKVNLPDADHELVVLTGANDAGYKANSVFPALVVLDPHKIIGSTESDLTRGFGFPPSAAQMYYVRTGNVNPSLVSGTLAANPCFMWKTKVESDTSLIIPQGFTDPPDFPKPMYTFDKNMKLLSAWMVDRDRMVLMTSYLTKKTAQGFDEFLRDMEGKVEYWDGSQWKKEPTKISHTLPPS